MSRCSETGYDSDWDWEPEEEDDYEEEIDEGPEQDWSGYHLISAPVASNGQPLRRPPAIAPQRKSEAA
jgi:hypothetical protein